jgi:universal stress protein family protein
VAVAEEVAADLIVMPTHGHRGIVRMLMGSVAERVVREAKRPVLTMRSGPGRYRSIVGIDAIKECPNDSCRLDDAKSADRRTER